MSQRKKQEWFCEKCGTKGCVEYEMGVNSDVMSVYYLIGDDHQERSPKCDQPCSMLRVINHSFRR